MSIHDYLLSEEERQQKKEIQNATKASGSQCVTSTFNIACNNIVNLSNNFHNYIHIHLASVILS